MAGVGTALALAGLNRDLALRQVITHSSQPEAEKWRMEAERQSMARADMEACALAAEEEADENDETDEDDDDPDLSCVLCGRVGGGGMFFNMVPQGNFVHGRRIVCHDCHMDDPRGAGEVDSFF